MRPIIKSLIIAATPLAFVPVAANAALTYTFQTDAPTYAATPGQVVPVQVNLRETLGPGDTSALGTEGLIGASILIHPLTPDAPQVLIATDITPGPGFDDPLALIRTPGTDPVLIENPDLLSPPVHGAVQAGAVDLPLGSFTFTTGATPGTYTYRITTASAGSQDYVLGDAPTALDDQIQPGTFSITVSVPEPASSLLALLPATALTLRRRRA